MSPRAKSQPRVNLQNRAAVRINLITPPRRTNKQPLANRRRAKILLPVIYVILHPAGLGRNLILNTSATKPLSQKLNRLNRVTLRRNIHMNPRNIAALRQQLFINKTNMRNALRLSLQIRVILNVNPVRHRHVGNRSRHLNIARTNFNHNLGKIHLIFSKQIFQLLEKASSLLIIRLARLFFKAA